MERSSEPGDFSDLLLPRKPPFEACCFENRFPEAFCKRTVCCSRQLLRNWTGLPPIVGRSVMVSKYTTVFRFSALRVVFVKKSSRSAFKFLTSVETLNSAG